MTDMSNQSAPTPRGNDGDNSENLFDLFKARPDDPAGIRYLRLAVISMGVILIIVFVGVVARLAYVLMRPVPPITSNTSMSSANSPATTAQPAAALMADIQVHLPASARLRGHTLSGNRMALHYDAPNGEGIMIVDLESGRPLSHIRLQAPRP